MAIATLAGDTDSAVVSVSYTILNATPTPTITPVNPNVTASTLISISDTNAQAVIYFTTDGTVPTLTSPTYSTPFSISASKKVQALAVAPGFGPSVIATTNFVITVETPTITPTGGASGGAVQVTLACAPRGATI